MAKPKLLVDIDGVLCDQGERMLDLAHSVSGGRFALDLDDFRSYYIADCTAADGARLTEDEVREFGRRYHSPLNLLHMPVTFWASPGLSRLSSAYDIEVVTARMEDTRAATVSWLATWTTFPFALRFAPHLRKHEVPGIAVAVEDCYEQAVLFAERGIPCFLMGWPWNTGRPAVDGVQWVSGWPDLTDRLLEIASS